jgi:hypothetical protein
MKSKTRSHSKLCLRTDSSHLSHPANTEANEAGPRLDQRSWKTDKFVVASQ